MTAMPRRRAAAAAAAACCAAILSAAPASAAPSWTAPVTLGTGQDTHLVAGTDGALLATWWSRTARAGAMRAAVRPAGGAWGAVFRTEPQGFGRPVALPGGRVLIVSGGDPGTGGRIRAWTGRLRSRDLRAVTIGHDNWDLPVAAVDSSGRAVAAWTYDQPRTGSGSNLRPRVVMVATRSRAGRWSRARRISPLPPAPPYGNSRGPRLSATALSVAAGGGGVVVAAWQRSGRIEARVSRDAGRTWGRVARLGGTTFGHPRIGVAVSPRGSFAVGWSTAPRVTGGRTLVAMLATNAPGGGFGRAFELGRGVVTQQALDPATDQFGARVLVAYSPAGNGHVAWQSGEQGRVGVRLARFTPGGAAPGALFLGDGDATTAVLGDLVAGAPGAAMAWNDVGATGQQGAVHVVTWLPGPVGGTLAAPTAIGAGRGARLAFSGGELQAVWNASVGTSSVVRAAQTPGL